MVIRGGLTNTLGIVRGFGKRGVQVMFLNSDRNHGAWYSKYVNKRLVCPDPKESEMQFVNFLINIGKHNRRRYMIIPVGDTEVLALSKYKETLEHFYFLPLPSFEVIQKLVNKKKFYKLLTQMSVPHPKTYFPKDISELRSIGQEIDYSYIIKPVYSHLFGDGFPAKCLLINSYQELIQAIEKLRNKNIEVVMQEIIPGKEIYMFYTYFNKESEPLAVCGYDKLRQYPPDFGCGSLCKSMQRQTPIDLAIHVLKAIKYHGIAEPEFKRDPRNGEYKLLEINARTSTENRLPARCGVDIEYIAYLDTIGQYVENSISPKNGILWIDEVGDLLSCIIQLKEGRLGIREVFSSLRGKKEYGVFTWDDPMPFLVALFNLGFAILRYLLRHVLSYIKSMMGK